MRGPAPLPSDRKRVYRIGVWFSQSELMELERIMATPGLADMVMLGDKNARKGLKSASEYLRGRALRQQLLRTVPEVNRGAYADLARIGNNLNQIATALNAGMLDAADRDIVAAAIGEIRELRALLMGMRPDDGGTEADDDDG